mgnify:CR=1 FL=1
MRLTMRLPGSLLSALLVCGGGLLAAAPARAGGIDLICALPSSRNGGLGTLVDFSLQEGSGSGSSFWPANGQRLAVLSRASSSEIQILQPGSGALLYHYGMKEFSYYTVLFSISRAMGMCSNKKICHVRKPL